MHAGRVIVYVVWAITPIAQAAVVASIILRGIVGEFWGFAVYLFADILLNAITWWFGGSPGTVAYRQVWVATQPLLLFFQTLVVLDFYRLLYRSYPGIHAFARILILVAVGVALVITFATMQLDVHRIVWRLPDVQRLFVVKRVVSSLLGIVVLTTMTFFPKAPSARNILLHGWLLAVLLIAAAGGLFGKDVMRLNTRVCAPQYVS